MQIIVWRNDFGGYHMKLSFTLFTSFVCITGSNSALFSSCNSTNIAPTTKRNFPSCFRDSTTANDCRAVLERLGSCMGRQMVTQAATETSRSHDTTSCTVTLRSPANGELDLSHLMHSFRRKRPRRHATIVASFTSVWQRAGRGAVMSSPCKGK